MVLKGSLSTQGKLSLLQTFLLVSGSWDFWRQVLSLKMEVKKAASIFATSFATSFLSPFSSVSMLLWIAGSVQAPTDPCQIQLHLWLAWHCPSILRQCLYIPPRSSDTYSTSCELSSYICVLSGAPWSTMQAFWSSCFSASRHPLWKTWSTGNEISSGMDLPSATSIM